MSHDDTTGQRHPVLATGDTRPLRTLLAHLSHRREELLRLARFDARCRWYERLRTDRIDGIGPLAAELWLLTWLRGQRSDWHDHGGVAGGFTVLAGDLAETCYSERAGVSEPLTWSPGPVRTFGPEHVHRVEHAGSVPAVSLHAYTPALTTMTRYAYRGGRLWDLTVERAGGDWLARPRSRWSPAARSTTC